MKKVLFTTTALVAFAGAASADIVLSGSAEMGIFNADTVAGGAVVNGETQFHTDIDVTFTMSGETDGGLTFGATVDLDESDDGDAFGNSTQGGETIFISGGFGTLTMGDTDGALDWAMDEVNVNGGSINDDETEHPGYNANSGLDGAFDGQIARYDNTFGDFGVALSLEVDDAGIDDEVLGLGVKYDLDLGGTTIALGLGYQETTIAAATTSGNAVGDHEVIGFSAVVGFGDVTAAFNYTDLDRPTTALSGDHIGIGLGYSFGAYALHANYGEFDFDDGTDADGFGLSVGYDLGGGASVHFGYGSGEDQAGLDLDRWSFGVAMSF